MGSKPSKGTLVAAGPHTCRNPSSGALYFGGFVYKKGGLGRWQVRYLEAEVSAQRWELIYRRVAQQQQQQQLGALWRQRASQPQPQPQTQPQPQQQEQPKQEGPEKGAEQGQEQERLVSAECRAAASRGALRGRVPFAEVVSLHTEENRKKEAKSGRFRFGFIREDSHTGKRRYYKLACSSKEHRELWLEGLSRAIEDSLHADRLHYGSLGAGSALDPRQPAVLVERRESFGSTVSANSGMESGGTFVPPSSLDQSLAGSSVTSRNLMLHVRSSSPPPPLGQEGGEDPMLSGSGTTLLSAPGPPAHQSSSSSQVQTATSTSSLGSAGSTGSCHSEVIVEGSVEVDQPRSRRRTLTEGQREEALRAFPPPKNPILFASSRVLLEGFPGTSASEKRMSNLYLDAETLYVFSLSTETMAERCACRAPVASLWFSEVVRGALYLYFVQETSSSAPDSGSSSFSHATTLSVLIPQMVIVCDVSPAECRNWESTLRTLQPLEARFLLACRVLSELEDSVEVVVHHRGATSILSTSQNTSIRDLKRHLCQDLGNCNPKRHVILLRGEAIRDEAHTTAGSVATQGPLVMLETNEQGVPVRDECLEVSVVIDKTTQVAMYDPFDTLQQVLQDTLLSCGVSGAGLLPDPTQFQVRSSDNPEKPLETHMLLCDTAVSAGATLLILPSGSPREQEADCGMFDINGVPMSQQRESALQREEEIPSAPPPPLRQKQLIQSRDGGRGGVQTYVCCPVHTNESLVVTVDGGMMVEDIVRLTGFPPSLCRVSCGGVSVDPFRAIRDVLTTLPEGQLEREGLTILPNSLDQEKFQCALTPKLRDLSIRGPGP